MDGFLRWFFEFVSEILQGYATIFRGIAEGFVKIFNIKVYIDIFKSYSQQFGAVGWILSVLAIILIIAVHFIIALLIILAIRKYIRFRHSIVSNEDLLEEIALLQRQVMKMTKEKDEIMAMKVAQIGGGTGSNFSLADTDFENEDAENIQQAAGEEGIIIT